MIDTLASLKLEHQFVINYSLFKLLKNSSIGALSTHKGIYKGIIGAKTIHERPLGMQLISGSNNSHIDTLVDRKTIYTALVQVDSKDTKSVIDALILKFNSFIYELKNTLTWDRRMELVGHTRFTEGTEVDV